MDRYIWREGTRRPKSRSVGNGLQKIWGRGAAQAQSTCRLLGVLPERELGHLAETQVEERTALVSARGWVGKAAVRQEREDRRRLNRAGTRKALRRRAGLPARGQRSQTNGRTAKRLNRGRRAVTRRRRG